MGKLRKVSFDHIAALGTMAGSEAAACGGLDNNRKRRPSRLIAALTLDEMANSGQRAKLLEREALSLPPHFV